MSDDRVYINDLLKKLSYELTEIFTKWRKEGANNDLRRDIAASMTVHGYESAGTPGLLPHIRRMVERGTITAYSGFNGLPATTPNQIEHIDGTWFVSHADADTVEQKLLDNVRYRVGTLTLSPAAHEEYSRQLADRHAIGRYRLSEAANIIAEPTGERAVEMLGKLTQAVRNNTVPVYEPGRQARYQSVTVRTDYEEAYWNDLNAWLDANETRITFRFPAPAETKVQKQVTGRENIASVNADSDGLTRREKQIRAILNEATNLQYDPLTIPDGGKKMLQSTCKKNHRDLFGAGNDPFMDAWKEAVKQKRIRMAEHDKYAKKG